MNRLILIGNGFDLAHGMKTSYNDFILWYLKKCFGEAFDKQFYEDGLIKIIKVRDFTRVGELNDVSTFVNFIFENGFDDYAYEKQFEMKEFGVYFYNPFKVITKSDFFNKLISKCSNSNWIDIENEFYLELKIILVTDRGQIKNLKILNDSLSFIIEQLEIYLNGFKVLNLNQKYVRIFNLPIYKEEICTKVLLENESVEKSLILNFNYTSTAENYLENQQINYIHGKINDKKNPLIFGFGDELDSDYPKIELQKVNEFFEHIKSFWYFKTSNYHNLVRFIESDEFQVYVLGHSCGLSDRTMLNMIFEHENCKSIKIFYHGTKEKNNYTNLTQEISRHFKDKGMMRKKIVPFDKSEPMPQAK